MKTFGICTMLFSLLLGASAVQAAPGAFSLSYGGRLANANDEAEKGPVDLTVGFYKVAKGGTPITEVPKTGVSLDDGVFQVDLDLTATERAQIFGDGSQPVWVEITDETHKKTYSRQMLTAVPYAIAAQSAQTVPVDGSTVAFGSDGKLKVIGGSTSASSISGKTVSATAPAAGQYLSFDSVSQSWVGKDPFSAPFTMPGVTTANETTLQTVTNAGKLWYNSSTNKLRANVNGTVETLATVADVDAKAAGYLKLDGSSAMSGNLNMSSHLLSLGQKATDPSGLSVGDAGKIWYNTGTNQIKYFDGTGTVVVGAAGSGLSSLNGATGSTQTFATPGTLGTAPAWSTATNIHTLNIPLASAAGVTAGLISKADYDTATGTIGTSRLAADAVTSAKIIDDTITNADINSAAAIADTKLATISTPGKVTAAALPATISYLGASIDLATETTGTLGVAAGGTGLTAPGTTGNVLTSNGSAWISAAVSDASKLPLAGGTMTGGLLLKSGSTIGSPAIAFADSAQTGLYAPAAHSLGIVTNNAARMVFDAGGNISIGTTTPAINTTFWTKRLDSSTSGPSVYASRSEINSTPAAASTATFVGSSSSSVNNGTYSITGLVGGQSNASNLGTGAITNAVGFTTSVVNTNGTIANAYGLKIPALTVNSGSVASYKGLYVDGSGGASSSHAIFATGAPSFFGDKVGIGTSTPTAILQVESTTSGFVPPRMSTSQMTSIVSPMNGMIVYDTTVQTLKIYNGTAWIPVGGNAPKLLGFGVNSGSACATMFSYPSGVNATLSNSECTVTLPGGYFTATPACTCTGFQGGGTANLCVLTTATTTSTVTVKLYTDAGTATAGQIHVTCVGI